MMMRPKTALIFPKTSPFSLCFLHHFFSKFPPDSNHFSSSLTSPLSSYRHHHPLCSVSVRMTMMMMKTRLSFLFHPHLRCRQVCALIVSRFEDVFSSFQHHILTVDEYELFLEPGTFSFHASFPSLVLAGPLRKAEQESQHFPGLEQSYIKTMIIFNSKSQLEPLLLPPITHNRSRMCNPFQRFHHHGELSRKKRQDFLFSS